MRPNRYALALATGSALGADVFALHECDNPVCVKVSGPGALCEHVGGWYTVRRYAAHGAGAARRRSADDSWAGARGAAGASVALREAVQGGVWDADAVANALLGVEPRLF